MRGSFCCAASRLQARRACRVSAYQAWESAQGESVRRETLSGQLCFGTALGTSCARPAVAGLCSCLLTCQLMCCMGVLYGRQATVEDRPGEAVGGQEGQREAGHPPDLQREPRVRAARRGCAAPDSNQLCLARPDIVSVWHDTGVYVLTALQTVSSVLCVQIGSSLPSQM